MPQLTQAKRLDILHLYFRGLPYEEIATHVGMGKGSVVNVIKDLRAGEFPQSQGFEEQLELLRETAVRLKSSELSPTQAYIGLSAYQGICELGVEPGEIVQLVDLCKELSPSGTETSIFVQAAMNLWEVRQETGMTPDALEEWVYDLQEKASALSQTSSEHMALQGEVNNLEDRKATLDAQVDSLQPKLTELEERKSRLEQREKVFMKRVDQLEERSHKDAITSVHEAAGNLRHQQNRLIKNTLDLAENIGRMEAELCSHEWLEPLLSLVQGKDDLQPQKVRILGLILLKSINTWLGQHQAGSPTMIRWNIERLIQGFEGWNV